MEASVTVLLVAVAGSSTSTLTITIKNLRETTPCMRLPPAKTVRLDRDILAQPFNH
jgi:hypothetical protein